MNVDTFCKSYQRKMWKSMITRKNLDLNIWDLIKYKKEKVYYMPYSGVHKFCINSRFCLKCSKELEIGFRKNEFIVNTCNCSADGKNYSTIEKLTTLFPSSEASEILKIFSEHRTRKLPNKVKYWLSQGLTEEEAQQKVVEIQKDRSFKSPSSKKGVKGFSIRTKEYWMKKGYTEEEARQRISNIQIGNGLPWYISRYGTVEGKKRYDQRIRKWLESYKKALENDPTINERKVVKFCNASKQSLKVLMPVYDKYKHKIRIYLGIDGNNEYFLRDGNSILFYDFTIPEIKLIVEYNGSKFHPNKNLLTEEELANWKSLFSNEDAGTVIAKDIAKKKIAEHHGYTLLTVWDTDNIENSIKQIENLIEERLNEI